MLAISSDGSSEWSKEHTLNKEGRLLPMDNGKLVTGGGGARIGLVYSGTDIKNNGYTLIVVNRSPYNELSRTYKISTSE